MAQPKSKIKWLAENRKRLTRRFLLELNKNTDADVIAKLDSVDSKQGYIKTLIREDLKRG